MKTLKSSNHYLSDNSHQLEQYSKLNQFPFIDQLKERGYYPLKPNLIDTLQVNLGKVCNQTCKHCHVDAGPDRKEIMSKETMEECLKVLDSSNISIVDITGGAPEMNPNFVWFVEEILKRKKHVLVRCNLTILLAGSKFSFLPEFYSKNKVEVVSSLPFYTALRTNAQRGDGVFEKSIEAIRLLNGVGYAQEGSGLLLDLVYNPAGAFLPANQLLLENEFKKNLKEKFGISFSRLFTITNMPISRFLDYLLTSGNYESYMDKLIQSFNPSAVPNVMCRNLISVSWDGYLYDCDFNQMLDLKIKIPQDHISQFNWSEIQNREIVVNQHCYGCTAGLGSSCGGTIAR